MSMINKNTRMGRQVDGITNDEINKLTSLLDKITPNTNPSVRTGTVSKIDTNRGQVWVDIQGKSEGIIPLEEFDLKGFGQRPDIGNTIEVWVENPEVANGKLEESAKYPKLSFAKASQIRSWWSLEQKYKNKEVVDGIVLAKIPAGYIISILPYGARGFLPISHADPIMSRSSAGYQKYCKEIHSYLIVRMERTYNIVLSRKEVILLGNKDGGE